ncbi:hypothetical protein [Ramlibacter pallidus]|uniref:Uncharacterized protein n=1 Tax=Ramlibacter pallidus TaxID=2780087 RepID=A0ABR9RZ41_9BURK|nr:hypothetical protein [Ramlibacter pallidus]MBE7366522.1 hypothetical protein [Ramlibacter pallidus]
MLNACEVIVPGMYWYYQSVGSPPRLVEVTRTPEGLVANLDATDGGDGPVLLARLDGAFEGPVRPAQGTPR